MEEIVIGMAHRGRLNVLTSILGKSYAAVFSEFQGGVTRAGDVQGSGDVKYHLGASADRVLEDGHSLHISLTPNPSHLEAVNPVVLGKVRAKQAMRGDKARERVMGLLIHGDAALAGQGTCSEVFELSELRGYRTGGTVHIVINNQIGFTTSPSQARTSPYPSEVAKIIQAPVFHVNGDDPEAVVRVCQIAADYRQQFKADVVVDIFCYRRHGHNEGDEPAFTQPAMYRAIRERPTTRQLYTERLVAEGVLTVKDADRMMEIFRARLETELEASKSYRPNKADWLEGDWADIQAAPATSGPATPPWRTRCWPRSAKPSPACQTTSPCTRASAASWRKSGAPSRRAARSTGRRRRHWPWARCCWRGSRSGSPARTARAAHSPSAMQAW